MALLGAMRCATWSRTVARTTTMWQLVSSRPGPLLHTIRSAHQIVHIGEHVHEQKCRFRGVVARLGGAGGVDVPAALEEARARGGAGASQMIFGWRAADGSSGARDDGERGAGTRIAGELLQAHMATRDRANAGDDVAPGDTDSTPTLSRRQRRKAKAAATTTANALSGDPQSRRSRAPSQTRTTLSRRASGDNDDGVLVIVFRWYGGSPLGSKRFRIISRVARDALQDALPHLPGG